MKELVSLHNITKDTDIEALLDVLMEEQEQFLADNAEAIAEDTPDDSADRDSAGSQSKNVSGEGQVQ